MISTIKIRHVIVAAVSALAFVATLPAIHAQATGVLAAEETVTGTGPNETATEYARDVAVELRGQFEEFQNETRRELQRQSDELRNELRQKRLDNRLESIDRWAETVTWWLTVALVILGFFAILVPIVGYFGYEKFKTEAESLISDIKSYRQQGKKLIQEMSSHTVARAVESPKAEESIKLGKAVEEVQRDPEASLIDKAIADTYTLQKAGKTKDAIRKWLSIANLTEGIDNEVAARAWFSIGFLAEDFEEQIFASTRAIQLNPEFAPAYNNRGAAKVALGRYDSAIPDFDKAIAIAPEYSAAYSNRGGAKKELGQYEDAIRDCDQALLIDPENAAAYYHRGGAKVHLKRYESAIQDYDQVIRRDPKYILAYIDRGAAKARIKHFDEARSDTQIAMHFAKEIGNEELMTQISDKMREIDNLEDE